MSWIAVDDPVAISRGDWMRLCFADPPGTDRLPYAERFMKNFERDFCYDRFWYRVYDKPCDLPDSGDAASRILNCGYAFSYVGSAKDGYFMNEKNGTRPTFENIYVEMGLIAHFQKAALLSFSERLTDMVERVEAPVEKKGIKQRAIDLCHWLGYPRSTQVKIKDQAIKMPDAKDVQKFYDDFVEFTQVFWFDEISPQEQGREIFQKWREKLRIEELYCDVRQQLQDLVEYVELLNARKLSHASLRLNSIVFIFAVFSLAISILTLIAGLYGMNNFSFNDDTVGERNFLYYAPGTKWILENWLWMLIPASLLVLCTCLFMLGTLLAIYYHIQKKAGHHE